MALKSFVLISSVNNLSDARYCAGMEVNLMGFAMESDKHSYIAPETFKELTEWISGVEYVGEFSHSNASQIKDTLANYETKYVEVKDPALVEPLQAEGYVVLQRVDIAQLDAVAQSADYLIIESTNDTVTEEVTDHLKALSQKQKVLIGFGITDENVEEMLAITGAHGIALSGGDEIKPGYKDYDELADILETLEIDDMAG